MQKLSILFMVLISALASAQKKETINVDPFNRISFGVPGNAYIKQGSTQRVEVEGSQEALDRIEVKVESGKLVIRTRDKWGGWNWSGSDRITVYITAKDIRGLTVSGSGNMETQTKIITGDLDVKVSGSGSLKAEVEANNLDASVSGSGRIKLRGKSNNVETSISGSGDIEAEMTIANVLDTHISGSGKLIASGKVNTFKTSISGSGSIRAIDLETEIASIKIAGSGSVEINVKRELSANISGSGSVRYKGDPNHVNANSSGSGKVRKIS
ncbi:MAG: DUF2807 domain-containing protein [Cyclobacteriaceae bacterium]|nr:DUF2807 domain-containing protein [Cyclobacteriaceae bacterium]